MTVDELKKVQYFTIENKYGKIHYPQPVDLTEVDLADIITITKGSAEVYDDQRHAAIKPPVGQKLNNCAIITLYDIMPKKNQSIEDKIKSLKQGLANAVSSQV